MHHLRSELAHALSHGSYMVKYKRGQHYVQIRYHLLFSDAWNGVTFPSALSDYNAKGILRS